MEIAVVTSILQYLAIVIASASLIHFTNAALIPLVLSTVLCVLIPAYAEKYSYKDMTNKFGFMCGLVYISFFICIISLEPTIYTAITIIWFLLLSIMFYI